MTRIERSLTADSRNRAFAFFLLVGFCGSASGERPRLVPIGDLPGGDVWSSSWSISPSGRWLAGYSHSGLGSEAVLWSESTGMVAPAGLTVIVKA